ncbi:unnamed protein product, partial [Polarella glacialis]
AGQNLDPVAKCHIPAPCRSLRLVLGVDAGLKPHIGNEARVLASAGKEVVELSIVAGEKKTHMQVLRSISVVPDSFVSGFDCFVDPYVWAQLPSGAYPKSLLAEERVVLAGGSVEGGYLWVSRGGRCSHMQHTLKGGKNHMKETISVELLDSKRMVAVNRRGLIFLAEWDKELAITVRWARAGHRMYVSTIRRREPLVLVSDGFDNSIQTIRITAPEDEDGQDE